jgi:predicted nucleic acid-binding protein
MPDKPFLDTNMVVYLYSDDEPEKRNMACALFDNFAPVISTQVLNELANTLRKKFGLECETITEVIAEVRVACFVFTVTAETICQALDLAGKYRYSYYDSLILSAALAAGCTTLITEDMQDGQIIDGKLAIRNPFLYFGHEYR